MKTAGGALGAAAVYLTLAVAISWPLATGLGHTVAGDFGDPLLVIWAMARVSTFLTRVLTGDGSAFAARWDANIFYPEPNTLAYSEHFAGQAILTLPLWWMTHNPILIYNVATLVSFVLICTEYVFCSRAPSPAGSSRHSLPACSRRSTHSAHASELSHLHVLTIQWFPFALLALHRYIERGSCARWPP